MIFDYEQNVLCFKILSSDFRCKKTLQRLFAFHKFHETLSKLQLGNTLYWNKNTLLLCLNRILIIQNRTKTFKEYSEQYLSFNLNIQKRCKFSLLRTSNGHAVTLLAVIWSVASLSPNLLNMEFYKYSMDVIVCKILHLFVDSMIIFLLFRVIRDNKNCRVVSIFSLVSAINNQPPCTQLVGNIHKKYLMYFNRYFTVKRRVHFYSH